MQHIFLVGAKSLGAYGGYETFIYKLTEYHQYNKKIKYQEKMIENVEDYDELKLLEENLESVNEKMKEIKLLYYKSLFLSEKNTKK